CTYSLSLHDALPIWKLDVMKLHAVHGGGELLVAERRGRAGNVNFRAIGDQRAAQLAQKAEVTDESGNDNQQAHWNGFHAAGATRSEEHTSELQSRGH